MKLSLPLAYYAFSGLLNFVTSFLLCLFVFIRSPNGKANRIFSFFCLLVAQWSFFYFLWLVSDTAKTAEFYLRTCMIGVVFMPSVFLSFIFALLKRSLNRLLNFSNYAASSIFAILIYSPLFANGVSSHLVFPFWAFPGPLFPIHLIHFGLNVVYAHYLMLNTIQHERGLLRTQILYVFIGTSIGYLAGITNYLCWYRVPTPPFLNPLVSVYVGSIAYAIIRHQLLEIEVIIKRTLVFAGLVASVVGVVSLVAFVSQDVLARFVEIPKWLSNVFAAAIIAALYGPLRNWLVNTTDRYLFQKKYDYKELLRKFTDEVMVMVNLKQLVQMTVNTLTETVKLQSTSLLLLNKDSRTYGVVAARGTNNRHLALEEQEPFITFLRETHEPIGKDGQLGKVRFPEAVTNRLKELNAALCLPLALHDELIGVLCLGKKKSDEEFAKDDLDILLPLARTLAIAVSNAQLFDELAKTQAEAAQKEKLAVIGTLSAGINHEICNPLGIVKAQCEAFLLDVEDGILIGKAGPELLDRSSTIMRVALQQIDRATAITQKLSNFAKPIKEPTAQPVAVEKEVDEVLLLVGHDLELGKIEVKREIEPELPPILVDRRQLQEVLFNLLRNAGQAITPPGTIWVRALALDSRVAVKGEVRIEISDTGSGIPPDKLSKIYDPFFTTKEPGKGTGLGLFIVRQIVERNKGRISVESTVGKGTTFFLDFPATKGVAELAGKGDSR